MNKEEFVTTFKAEYMEKLKKSNPKLFTEEINFESPKCGIIYVAPDGKKFDNVVEYLPYAKAVRRQIHYDAILKNRNWFERLFNIKPNMDLYDSLS